FAILYLPYSIVGPFVGVLLDRWSRRQVLLYGNGIRALVVLVVAWLTSNGSADLTLGFVVLIALGINRFILAGLSASLPHTVTRQQLVAANAFSPTIGTLFAALGGLFGVVVRGALGGGDAGSVTLLMVAAVGFAVSGILSLRMPKNLLGPDGSQPRDTLGGVAAGFVEGTKVLWATKLAFRAVAIVTIHRTAFGVVTALVILLIRNTLNPITEPEQALGQISLVIGAAAGGAFVAAVITPRVTKAFGVVRYTSAMLVLAGIVTTSGMAIGTMPSLLVGAAALGVSGQAVKICADTVVQELIHDDHRGRVFTLYDVVINIGLVVGVAFVALTSPASGQSILDLIVIAVMLLLAALWYYRGRNTPAAQIAVGQSPDEGRPH
ncbi:MAG: MFS transporter, partial [Actinobacteria bacterium]|nr:MFS transporter [Actinomycetota bacterium]